MNENKMTVDEIIGMSSNVDGGGVWLMKIEQYRYFADRPYWKDHNGELMFIPPGLSGYGTLLGRKIAIVDFDYFGIARI